MKRKSGERKKYTQRGTEKLTTQTIFYSQHSDVYKLYKFICGTGIIVPWRKVFEKNKHF